ncbi:Putative SOS response-associated peptidase YedK [Pirellulimonas nuda]|uniref:Abasic site processing protein n=1 Tax=Pirellulimonas nuda TaxID=2528009 RepID=A0A518D5C5_9BACT|nr:SOS response-associated peptidase [Pirellulimonas nuda]QDU86668.1 Putative SOS response-associated peptidase YedK [Pirellulimonas nuda]
MCGRFTLKTPARDLIAALDLASSDRQLGLFEPRWNIAPTQQVPVVRLDGGAREAVAMRWGLIPSWSKEPGKGAPLINARSETVAEKPSFRTALKRRRCLMPADGFYEWQESGGKGAKQPFYIHRKDDGPFAFAALWECWRSKEDPAAAPVESCTLVNTEAVGWMTEIHHRMPVILEPKDFDVWLDPELQEAGPLAPLFAPAEHNELVAQPVSTYVNKATNEGPRCVEVQKTLF